MMFKSVTVMLLASSLAAAELEKRDDYGDGYDYYSSLEAELSSLGDYNTDYLNYLTDYSDIGGYTDKPTDYSPSMPDATETAGNTDHFGDATVTPPPNMPSVTFDMPPPSIESVLETAIPASFLSEMANPSAASSVISEIQNGNTPSWYDDLPGSVKSWLNEHYATGAMPTATGASSAHEGGGHNAAPPSGMIATGLMGAACILAVAVLL